MKKLVQINSVCYGSTGNIMKDIQSKAIENNFETISFYGRGKGFEELRCEKFGNSFSFLTHVVLGLVFDLQGFGSYFSTKKLIKRLKEENPDIIHMHNLHGYYIHLPQLFKFLKEEYKGKVFWTLHDCWSFTGHCAYFELAKCDKWKSNCYNCPNKKEYPPSLLFDNSKFMYKKKKEMFNSIFFDSLIVPSKWLKNYIKLSFLKNQKVSIINNGIDLNIFKNVNDEKILDKYSIPRNKRIILCVANVWEKRKGLDYFIDISKLINEETIIVLVGMNKKQIKQLKDNKKIYCIERTKNKEELAKIYSAADVFINPSIEETFSLATLESIACGTPVAVTKNTPMEEYVDKTCGVVCEDLYDLDYIFNNIPLGKIKVDLKKYDKNRIYDDVIKIYNQ